MKRPEKSGRKNTRGSSSDKKEFKGSSERGGSRSTGASSRGPRKDSEGPRTRRSSSSTDDFSKPLKGRTSSRPSDLDSKPRRKKDFNDFDAPRSRESKSSWDDFDASEKGPKSDRGTGRFSKNESSDRPYARGPKPESKRSYHGSSDRSFSKEDSASGKADRKPYSRAPRAGGSDDTKRPYSRGPRTEGRGDDTKRPYSRGPRIEGSGDDVKRPYSRGPRIEGSGDDTKRPYSKGPRTEGRGDDAKRPYSKDSRTAGRFYKKDDDFKSDRPTRRPDRTDGPKKPFNRAPKVEKSPYRRSDDKIPFKPGDNEEGPRKRFNPDKGAFRSKKAEKGTFTADGPIRLNRYISMAGICSRREADEMILAGVVSVNGEVITELGTKVQAGDEIRYNGEKVRNEELKYVLLNKPKDYITTMEDPEARKTVMELIASACKERVYPVGRLDRNTTGLLLFTNDGDLAKVLTHPSSMVRKIYHVELNKNLKIGDMKLIAEGIELEDGFMQVDEIAFDGDGSDKKMIGLQIHSGKNRIVRRIFEHLGYEVIKLDRVMFAGLTKKDLPRGRYRLLSETEVGMLKMVSPKKMKASR